MKDLSTYKLTSSTIDTLVLIAKSMTLSEALCVLEKLNSEYLTKDVYVLGQTVKIKFEDLVDDPYNLMKPLERLANIWYFGGSPGHEEWRLGSVSQYVTESLLYELVQNGSKQIESLVYDLVAGGAP